MKLIAFLLGVGLSIAACASNEARIEDYGEDNRALILIDLQVDFLEGSGRMPVAQDQVAQVIGTANRLAAEFSARGLPLLSIVNRFKASDIGNLFRNFAAIEGSPGAALDPRVMVAGPILSKSADDAFSNPALGAWLEERRINHLVIAGVFAEGCVAATAQGALRRGYRVSIPASGLGSSDDASLNRALRSLREAGVEVIDEYR